MKGRLIVSLDFELHWGVFDHCHDNNPYMSNLYGARTVIPKLLDLFSRYRISATWATVGVLFAKNKDDFRKYTPDKIPSYVDNKLNAYNVSIGDNEKEDPLHYGMSLIKEINSHEGQEIATHTFSHYYCLEDGQTKEEFTADIKAAYEIAKDNGIKMSSIVFPRNQYNPDYISSLKDIGFTVFRGNQPFVAYEPQKATSYNRLTYKATRLFDSFFNLKGNHVYTSERVEGLINSRASYFIRPYSKRFPFFNRMQLRRIKKSMSYAAKNGGDVHIWWHPHNLGINQTENLLMLEELFEKFDFLRKEFGMKSIAMKDLR